MLWRKLLCPIIIHSAILSGIFIGRIYVPRMFPSKAYSVKHWDYCTLFSSQDEVTVYQCIEKPGFCTCASEPIPVANALSRAEAECQRVAEQLQQAGCAVLHDVWGLLGVANIFVRTGY